MRVWRWKWVNATVCVAVCVCLFSSSMGTKEEPWAEELSAFFCFFVQKQKTHRPICCTVRGPSSVFCIGHNNSYYSPDIYCTVVKSTIYWHITLHCQGGKLSASASPMFPRQEILIVKASLRALFSCNQLERAIFGACYGIILSEVITSHFLHIAGIIQHV